MKELFKGKTILITGGTGYLGRALTRRLLEYEPKKIRVFSRDEVKHFRMDEEFNHDDRISHLVGDVRDYKRVERAVRGADIVIHAAAMKRIDMIEYNVFEGIQTNVLGTMNVVDACLANNVEKAVYISTDKACLPVNSYGAMKLLGERIFIESNYSKGSAKTAFFSVRYGNVLESTGSVIPFFVEKIKSGKEIPITDNKMTRFIISHDQAADLVFFALQHGIGGEVFVPKLPAFKLPDLAAVLKKHYNSRNPTKVIGIRPGEKLDELMVNEYEAPFTYDLGKYMVITSQIEKYLDRAKYAYLKDKPTVSFKEYSSRDAVVTDGELEKILKEVGALNDSA